MPFSTNKNQQSVIAQAREGNTPFFYESLSGQDAVDYPVVAAVPDIYPISVSAQGMINGNVANAFFDIYKQGTAPTVTSGLGGLPPTIHQLGIGTVTVESSAAADAAAGTGLQKVAVYGLGATGVFAEIVDTDGVTPVTSTIQYSFADVIPMVTGSNNRNAGNITLKGGTTEMGYIPINNNQYNPARLYVPVGWTAYIEDITVVGGADDIFYRWIWFNNSENIEWTKIQVGTFGKTTIYSNLIHAGGGAGFLQAYSATAAAVEVRVYINGYFKRTA